MKNIIIPEETEQIAKSIVNMHLGFLVNFNVPLIKNGIKRIIY